MAAETLCAKRPSPGANPRGGGTGAVYHVYPHSFADANGDGIGNLRGIVERLDYLNDGTPESLGVSAIWLSPIYLSPGRDAGYDIADHTAVEPTFGDLDDFNLLVAEARRCRIHIVLDPVINHTSDLHQWFGQARASRDSAKRDWYVWRDPASGRRPPHNWRSFSGGSAWEYDDETDQFYLPSCARTTPVGGTLAPVGMEGAPSVERRRSGRDGQR